MAREVSRVCNFFFRLMHTNLPMDTVDVKLILRMVHGIYIYLEKIILLTQPFLLHGVKV